MTDTAVFVTLVLALGACVIAIGWRADRMERQLSEQCVAAGGVLIRSPGSMKVCVVANTITVYE